MLPCIVIDLFLNNQPDALIIQIYSVLKLYVFRASSLPIQDFSTVHSALVSYMQVFDDRFQAGLGPDPAWKRSSKTCMKLTSAECTVENSGWWAEKMPETRRVLRQNKFG